MLIFNIIHRKFELLLVSAFNIAAIIFFTR